ncbi:hypothetical protein [Haloarchaeobius iranensis]|uniref:Uncharacterized protein n=1 Tax=Haloarchaeobius iranensis TaxID=996166 RepID=A0A1G9UX27_9EURY|nr:hypothetical protein [Haloarchaeobius iranensis]SDM64498.1 hypothetical protein SAMN05192554_10558 [Haloarchaeobius iranensis]
MRGRLHPRRHRPSPAAAEGGRAGTGLALTAGCLDSFAGSGGGGREELDGLERIRDDESVREVYLGT